jgi:hypothetical protein
VVEYYASRRVEPCSLTGIVLNAPMYMTEQTPNEIPLADPEEVVAIGNPESKPKHALSFRLPSGHPTRRQAKNRARLENIVTNPKFSDDDPQESLPKQQLSPGQKKRIRYHKRTGTK